MPIRCFSRPSEGLDHNTDPLPACIATSVYFPIRVSLYLQYILPNRKRAFAPFKPVSTGERDFSDRLNDRVFAHALCPAPCLVFRLPLSFTHWRRCEKKAAMWGLRSRSAGMSVCVGGGGDGSRSDLCISQYTLHVFVSFFFFFFVYSVYCYARFQMSKFIVTKMVFKKKCI